MSYEYEKQVDTNRLTQEIQESSITVALDYMTTTATHVTIYFKAALSSGEEDTLDEIVDDHVNTPLPDDEVKTVALDGPKDVTNRLIVRPAATISGWHYQVFTVGITTSKYGGYYCKDEDGTDITFASHKIYDSNGDEITSSANEANAVKTCVWFRPNHDYEIIGARYAQAEAPSTDVRVWVIGLPGVANVKFSRGGINLKHVGAGTISMADGRAAKYLQYNALSADANSFKLTFRHDAGVQHECQVSFELFKAP